MKKIISKTLDSYYVNKVKKNQRSFLINNTCLLFDIEEDRIKRVGVDDNISNLYHVELPYDYGQSRCNINIYNKKISNVRKHSLVWERDKIISEENLPYLYYTANYINYVEGVRGGVVNLNFLKSLVVKSKYPDPDVSSEPSSIPLINFFRFTTSTHRHVHPLSPVLHYNKKKIKHRIKSFMKMFASIFSTTLYSYDSYSSLLYSYDSYNLPAYKNYYFIGSVKINKNTVIFRTGKEKISFKSDNKNLIYLSPNINSWLSTRLDNLFSSF